MRFTLFPREESYFELFNASARNIHKAAKAMTAMMAAYDDPPAQAARIKELEHQGDRATHEIMKRLNQTFITPFDREDIHALASALDDVLDLIDGVADRMVVFKIATPTPEAHRLAVLIEQSAAAIVAGVSQLNTLAAVAPLCVEINRLENEADREARDAVGRLFEEQRDPLTIMKWKEIYETLEAATDRCEDVANVLENIALKNA